jgi:hypothetical protein
VPDTAKSVSACAGRTGVNQQHITRAPMDNERDVERWKGVSIYSSCVRGSSTSRDFHCFPVGESIQRSACFGAGENKSFDLGIYYFHCVSRNAHRE